MVYRSGVREDGGEVGPEGWDKVRDGGPSEEGVGGGDEGVGVTSLFTRLRVSGTFTGRSERGLSDRDRRRSDPAIPPCILSPGPPPTT